MPLLRTGSSIYAAPAGPRNNVLCFATVIRFHVALPSWKPLTSSLNIFVFDLKYPCRLVNFFKFVELEVYKVSNVRVLT